MQFPVSSGQHHRLNENEWVPVVPPKPLKKDKELQKQTAAITIMTETSPVAGADEPTPVPLPVSEMQSSLELQPLPSASIFADPTTGKVCILLLIHLLY